MAFWLKAAWALALIAAVPPAHAQDTPSKTEFAAAMIAQMKEAAPEATLTPNPDDALNIRFRRSPNEEEGEINLHRVFEFCGKASADDCEESKARFVRGMAAKIDTSIRSNLRLVVRDRGYVDAISELGTAGSKPPAWILEPIGEDLYALLASDSPDSTAILPEAELEKLKLTRGAAWKLAAEQTRAKLPPLPTADQVRQGVAFEGRDYLASLLIDRLEWIAVANEVGPDLFVTVVSDGFVFVGAMPDGPHLDSFAKAVEEDCAQAERCISPYVYRLRGGQWVRAAKVPPAPAEQP